MSLIIKDPQEMYREAMYREAMYREMNPPHLYSPAMHMAIPPPWASAQGGGLGVVAGKHSDANMDYMLQARMGWNVGSPHCPFKKISSHKLNDEQAVTFVIHGEKALVIHDDLNLFPSDALVTQLRLLESNK
jgi:hypothetical protein